jgi:signal transduction histidine kinase
VPGTDRLELVALKHRDPELHAAMKQVLAEPIRIGEGVAGKVAETGKSVLMPELDLAALRGGMKADVVRFLEQHPMYGFVTVPIRARGQVIGTLSVARFVKEPRLQPEDQTMIEELADRAALAIVDAEQFAALQRTEAAVQIERAKFESLVMQAPVPMAVYEGPDARLVLLNDAGSRIASREKLGMPLREAFPEMEGSPTPQAILDVYRTGQPRQLPEHVTQIRGADGIVKSYALVSSLVPLRDAMNEVYGVLASAIDVSEQVQARESVEKSLRFAEQFIGMLGHDLRNPLNAIQVAATLVRETSTDATKRYLDRILASSKRMSSMVSQLLDLTRTRLAEGIALERTAFDFAQTIDSVLSELELIYAKREVRRVVRGDTRGNWDEDRLARVVSNLVGNALQHGDSSRPVEVRLIGEGPQVRFEVQNYGEVIAAELLPTIFDPYRRSDARSRTSEGLGLGLYITQQIVLAHGGTIAVRSGSVQGTVFEVVLPRVAPDTV